MIVSHLYHIGRPRRKLTGFLRHAHRWVAASGDGNSASGSLTARLWARGIATLYTNTAAGQLVGIGYSGSASTPNAVFSFDHQGRPIQIAAGSSYAASRAFDDAGRLLGER